MGSFASTCAVSGLPLEVGDPVRAFLVTQNPYTESLKCYVHDLWFPRTYGLKAKYNDYGSIEDVEEGPARDLWMEGLQLDLIEKGWGSNQYHDPPALKNMSFEALLGAIWEGQVFVKRDTKRLTSELVFGSTEERMKKLGLDTSNYKRLEFDTTPHPAIPTLHRLMDLLREAKLPLFGEQKGDGYMVEEAKSGFVTVRWSGYEDAATKRALLDQAIAVIAPKFAAMIIAGEGSGTINLDVLVAPRHDVVTADGNYGVRMPFKDEEEAPLIVKLAMVREDVWQSLVKMGLELPTGYGEDKSIDVFKAVRDTWNRDCQALSEDKAFIHLDRTSQQGGLFRGRFDPGDVIPFTVGLGTHWLLMVKKAGTLDKKQTEEFTKVVAETHFVTHALAMTRYMWRPSYSNGPQFGEWRLHEQMLSAFAQIAKVQADKDDKDRAEWDEEFAAEQAKKKKKKGKKS
jgi:hypothetical protein